MEYHIPRPIFLLLIGVLFMTTQLAAQTSSPPLAFVTAQPANDSLARVFLGAIVTNLAGETVGDIFDVVFDKTGQINTVVLGVGGFLGLGEKNVAVPFSALNISASVDGHRSIVISATREMLKLAPAFVATEKTTLDVVKDKVVDLGHITADKANELKEQAVRKIEEITKSTEVKK